MLNRLPYILILFICLCACSARIVNTRNVYETPQLSSDSVRLENNYIKVHLTNGFLAVLSSWEIDDLEQLITGRGFYYDTNREETSVNSTSMIFNYEDIVLVETNEYKGLQLDIAPSHDCIYGICNCCHPLRRRSKSMLWFMSHLLFTSGQCITFASRGIFLQHFEVNGGN